MRDISVRTTKEVSVPVEQLYKIRKSAFSQWEEAGLDASEAHCQMKAFADSLRTKTVFVAHDTATGELLAMHAVRLNRHRKVASGSDLAVLRISQHEGIATRMLQVETERLSKTGYRYMSESTAIPAKWSVKWHLKNGYHITGYKRSEKKNYASYILRKPLALNYCRHPQDLLWLSPIAPFTARLYYITSYLVTCICKKQNGKLTTVGRIAKKLLK